MSDRRLDINISSYLVCWISSWHARHKEQLPCVTLSRICRPTYSDYIVEKTNISRIDSKLIKAKFKPNFGYMCFFNHITTVCGWTNLSQAKGCLAWHSFLHFAAEIKLVVVIVIQPSWAERTGTGWFSGWEDCPQVKVIDVDVGWLPRWAVVFTLPASGAVLNPWRDPLVIYCRDHVTDTRFARVVLAVRSYEQPRS